MSNKIHRSMRQVNGPRGTLDHKQQESQKDLIRGSLLFGVLVVILLWTSSAKAADFVPCHPNLPSEVWQSQSNGDQTAVAFIQKTEKRYHLCVLTYSGKTQTVASTDAPGYFSDIVWSHDGSHFLFTQQDGNPYVRTDLVIFLVDIKTNEITRVNPDDVPVADQATWSSDDKYIAFSGYRLKPNFDIYIVESDDVSHVVYLGIAGQSEREPFWLKDHLLRYISLPSNTFGTVDLK